MKRLFIGIPLESEKAVQTVEIWRNDPELNQNVLKWTKTENWHTTLFFLGNTPEKEITLLGELIDESFRNIPFFTTELVGVGLFPDNYNPKVLWFGLEDMNSLMCAFTRMKELLLQNGFSPENKPLKPHLTLARIKKINHRTSFKSFVEQHRHFVLGPVEINSVILYESTSSSDGPVYKPLFVKPLMR